MSTQLNIADFALLVCIPLLAESQLMLTNPRDAFRGQSRSPNMVPFHMLGMVFYSNFVRKTQRF